MLITPRTYLASQTPDREATLCRTEGVPRFYTLAGWRQSPAGANPSAKMLLVHQVGSVRVGEIARSVSHALGAFKDPCDWLPTYGSRIDLLNV